jgi:short-subunit dehydrogenase
MVTLGTGAILCNLSRSKPYIFLGDNGRHFPVDLADAEQLAKTANELGQVLREAPPGEVLLVNNSGFGDYGPLAGLDPQKQLTMIDLNIRAVVDLSCRLLPAMLERGGCIVTIASTAAFQPTPFLATYGASKSFVRNWSLALSEDLRDSGVRTLAVCPGPTRSNFFKAAGFTTPPIGNGSKNQLDMSAEEVAQRTLQGIAREKTLLVTGWRNQLITFFGAKLPIVAVTRVGAMILRKMRLEKHRQ